MAAGPRTLNGKIVLQVYLLDNSYKTLLIEPTSTVSDVCRAMAEKIGFSDPEDDSLCFSLSECLDGATIGRALPPEKEVLGIMEAWFGKAEAKLVFQCKLYTDGIINSGDPKIIHMQFIQAVYNVITGAYPTTDKDAVSLAALQVQAKFGVHKPESHKPGFLTASIMEYIPTAHLAKKDRTTEEWEKLIFHKHAFSTSSKPREDYIAFLSKRDYFGCVLFAVKQFDRSLPKKVLLGISRRGIVLIKIPKSTTEGDMETLARFALADIYRWAYKPGVNFYFEIKNEEADLNPVYTYDTAEGKVMSDMLTDYALALLREMGLNPDGTKRVKPRDRAPAATASAAPAPAAPPAAAPTKSAMAGTTEAYKTVAGDVGSLASAAVRSGEYKTAGATAGGAASASSAPPPPPPPPAVLAPPPPPPSANGAAETLPPNWIKCFDESSNDWYYFNTVSGDSVWDRDEIPAA